MTEPDRRGVDGAFERMQAKWARVGTADAWPAVLGILATIILSIVVIVGYARSRDRAPRVEAVAIEPNAMQCPAPTRAGEVSTITLIHHGDAIKFRCQLVRDWQLLNPKAKRPITGEGP